MAKPNKASDTTRLLDEGNAAHKGLRRFLQAMVHMTQPKTVVEIGTGKAASAICMALAGMEYGTKVYTFDSVRRGQRPIIAAYLGKRKDRVKVIFKAGEDVIQDDFDDREIDLLFIDANHGYQETKHVFENFLVWMAESGVIVIHDIAVKDKGEAYGAWKFWKDIREEKAMFPMYPGIGIVWAGTAPLSINEAREMMQNLDGFIPEDKKSNVMLQFPDPPPIQYEPATDHSADGVNSCPMMPKKKKPMRGRGGKFVKTKKDE